MAKIGELLGLGNNPFYQGFSGNRQLISGAVGGMAANPLNPWGGFAQGAQLGGQLDTQMAQEEQAKAQETEQTNMTKEWLRSRGRDDLIPLVDAGQGMFALQQATQPAEQGPKPVVINGQLVDPMTGQIMGDYRDQAGEGGGAVEYGLTPIWGQMPDGTFGYGVQGKDGSFQQVDTGNLSPLDPRSLAGERAFGTQMGTAQGQGAASAQGDISNADTALDLINQIKTSPELPWATGRSVSFGGNDPRLNPQRFAFQNLVEQAKSGAFLTAIQEMKGLGALSNNEGQAATAAITRMNTALEKDDFLKAVEDYERIITRAKERAQGRVGMQPNVNAPRGGLSPGNYVFNPATGALEPQ